MTPTSAAWSRRRSANSTSPRSPPEPRATDGGAGPGIRPRAVPGGSGAGQARRVARAARAVRGRAEREPRARRVLLLAVLLDHREDRRTRRPARRGGRGAAELSFPADREPPHARDLSRPLRVRAAVG